MVTLQFEMQNCALVCWGWVLTRTAAVRLMTHRRMRGRPGKRRCWEILPWKQPGLDWGVKWDKGRATDRGWKEQVNEEEGRNAGMPDERTVKLQQAKWTCQSLQQQHSGGWEPFLFSCCVGKMWLFPIFMNQCSPTSVWQQIKKATECNQTPHHRWDARPHALEQMQV